MKPKKFNMSVYEDMTKAEEKVARFLAEKGIWWNFEQPIYLKIPNEKLTPKPSKSYIEIYYIYQPDNIIWNEKRSIHKEYIPVFNSS